MAQRLREKLRSLIRDFIEQPGARLLNSLGLTPNTITILGFAISAAAAAVVALGHLWIGGLIFLAGSGLDMFDGALARMTGRATAFGALLDSLFDRLGEAALYLGLAIFVVNVDPETRNVTMFIALLLLSFAASQSVSYLRARGEALNMDMHGGIMTRTERVMLLTLGLLIGEDALLVVLAIIAALSLWTMASRLIHIWRGLKAG